MIYDKICVMLPSRGRVKNGKLPKLIDSAYNTAGFPGSVLFSILVDEEDTETLEYLRSRGQFSQIEILINMDKRGPHLGRFFNEIYERTRFNDPGTLVSLVGDDMVFLTPGWDARILDTVNAADGNAVVYCDDDNTQHENLCVHLFTTRKIVEATGKPFMCPWYAADYIDVVWMKVGQQSGTLRYLGDVKIKHEHSAVLPPEQRDATFNRLRGSYTPEFDPKRLHQFVDEAVANLKVVMKTDKGPTIYMMLPGMMNNGGHKVGAQWVRMLIDHGHKAILANTHGEPCKDFWDFTVPVCSFADVPDSANSIVVWNWGDDLRKRTFQHAKQYYYAQDCCQPHYPGHEHFMPLIKGMKMITIGHHSDWFHRYTQGIDVVGVVNNYVDQNVFKYDANKHLDSRAFNVCMMEHREHWNPSFIGHIQNLGFNLVVAKGTQAQVAEAINKSAYFVSFAEGVQTPYGKIEGFPLPTAEAMAAGCITLAMDNCGNTEYLLDSVNGFFHTGADSAVDIIRQLMLDSSDRKFFIAENAYRTFKYRFNKERTYLQIKKALGL